MATGVLPIAVGRATKIISSLPDKPKKYTAIVKFGMTSDTLDITGKILNTSDKKTYIDEIKSVIPNFLGEIEQLPPMYSAVSQNGQRLYDLARKGKTVERKKRHIKIYSIDLIDFDKENQELEMSVECSKGTYIRSLADDIGKELGCGGLLKSLRRDETNGINLEECIDLDYLKTCDNPEKYLIPCEKFYEDWRKLKLSKFLTRLYINGVKLTTDECNLKNAVPGENLAVYSDEGIFIGTAIIDTSGEKILHGQTVNLL